MKLIIYGTQDFEKRYLKLALSSAPKAHHQLVFTKKSLNEETANLAKDFKMISIFIGDEANERVLKLLHKIGIRYIALRMAGYDNIDLEACKRLGIRVANVPEYSPFAVAEHAMTMILCLNRKIKLSQELIKKSDFRLDKLIGFDMRNKTIGIVGVGKIGAALAKIANGFGCKLLAFDPYENQALKNEIELRYVDLDELCKKSDIISLHCQLNSATKHLLNKAKFAMMKREVLIVNTSRGGVIKTEDLLEALKNNQIGGVGLDVYEFERGLFFKKHQQIEDELFKKLQEKPNVIITGHQAFLTDEALQNIASSTIYNLDCWQNGEISKNEL